MKKNKRFIKAGITARGYLTALKDYKEPAVIEEVAANSYDADATTVLILLDAENRQLHILDDGTGFTKSAIEAAAVLGGGDKRDVEYSYSKRPYLGAYGFGLKATIKVAHAVSILTVSGDGIFDLTLDWRRLDEALKSEATGFELAEAPRPRGRHTGTHLQLELKNPTETILEQYHKVLSNLPTDDGKCRYYTGRWQAVKKEIGTGPVDFARLKLIARAAARRKAILVSDPSSDPDLKHSDVFDFTDKEDKDVKCRIFFAGFDGDKVRPLKRGLRGIYVRIQGRLLKQSFDDQRYVYPISKWVKFAAGIRVELTIDWLRNEISLSREGLSFSNPKLEEQFRKTIARNVSAFIAPRLKELEKRANRRSSRKWDQRLELARQRATGKKGVRLASVGNGFPFKPETDGELALLIANPQVVRRVNPSFVLIDYNDQAPFDCIIWDKKSRDYVYCELEPTLIEFLHHKETPEGLRLIVTWSLGKWRMGARKKGVRSIYQLKESDQKKRKGWYKLLAFKREGSRQPFRDYDVVALDDIIRVQ